MIASVYKKHGKTLIALASWAPAKTEVNLSIDWKALGLEPGTTLTAPAIGNFQPAARHALTGIPVDANRGWLLIAE